MGAIDFKGTGSVLSCGHYFNSTILHDGGESTAQVVSPVTGGETLLVPQGAGVFRVKGDTDVSFLLPDNSDPGGAITLVVADGWQEFHICGWGGKNPRYPNRIVLDGDADFMFLCDTPDGGDV